MSKVLTHFIKHDKNSHNNILCNANDCSCPECQNKPLPKIKNWWKNIATPGPDAYKRNIPAGAPTPEQEALWQKKLDVRRKIARKYR